MSHVSPTTAGPAATATTTATAAVFPCGPAGHHLCSFLELFIDVMYADVVLNDRCCRRVGDALVTDQEATLRAALAAAGAVMPAGLHRAIGTYCVRQVLLRAPELMLTTPTVGDALLQLADQLRGEGEKQHKQEQMGSDNKSAAAAVPSPMAALAGAIAGEVAALRKRLETRRYAHLVDSIGDAVVAHMGLAADEMRTAATSGGGQALPPPSLPLLPSAFTQRFLPTVGRFALAAACERHVRKRRRDADLNQVAGNLLFATPQQGEEPGPSGAVAAAAEDGEDAPAAAQHNRKQPPRRGLSAPTTTTVDAATAHSFSEEIQAAMSTPVQPAMRMMPQATAPVAAVPKHRRPALNDSIQTGLDALHGSDTSSANKSNAGAMESVIAVDSSLGWEEEGQVSPGRHRRTRRAAAPASVGANEASVLAGMETGPAEGIIGGSDGDGNSREATPTPTAPTPAVAYVLASRGLVERSYFLCAATNRFEPMAARGFFPDDE